MSHFYTSVERYGSSILWRGYKNGQRFSQKVKFEPTLYITGKGDSEYKPLIGNKSVHPKRFESMNAAKEFVEEYKDVHGIEIFGNTNYAVQFIQETYPGQIKFDPSLINIAAFDIEVDISGYKYPGHNKVKVRKKSK